MATVLYRGPFREPCELEESEERVSPRTPYLALLAGVGERAPGIHLSSGDKSFNGGDVTVRLRVLKLQLRIAANNHCSRFRSKQTLPDCALFYEFVKTKNIDKDSMTLATTERQIQLN